jgi:hypothetical protein
MTQSVLLLGPAFAGPGLELEPGLAPLALGPGAGPPALALLEHSPASSWAVAVLALGLRDRRKSPLTMSWRRIACSISGVNCTPCNDGKYIPGFGFGRVAAAWDKFGEGWACA